MSNNKELNDEIRELDQIVFFKRHAEKPLDFLDLEPDVLELQSDENLHNRANFKLLRRRENHEHQRNQIEERVVCDVVLDNVFPWVRFPADFLDLLRIDLRVQANQDFSHPDAERDLGNTRVKF